MVGNRTLNEISSLLTYLSAGKHWEAGEKKCAVFAQFWEAVGSFTSHLFIDDQSVSAELRTIKKLRRNVAVRQH
jgi:hypothetical protein